MVEEQKKFIVLIEDNADDVALINRAFAKMDVNCDVMVLRDGVEALDYFFGRGPYRNQHQSRIPDLILLDLKLPKVNGLDLLRQLNDSPHLWVGPIVVLSSSGVDRDMYTAYLTGASSYIQKSVDFEEFVAVIRKIADYWLNANRVPSDHMAEAAVDEAT